MRAPRRLAGLVLSAALLGGLAAAAADAKPGGFSGGRSYSSGGRSNSFSRPSSGGRSYSSGRSTPSVSHTARAVSHPGPSPASRPAGKGYSSGTKGSTGSHAAPSRPAVPSGKSYGAGGVAAP